MTEAENKTVDSELTIEQSFEKLEGIIGQMESRDVSLEDSFDLYTKGIGLLKNCATKLDTVEKQVKQIESDGRLGALSSDDSEQTESWTADSDDSSDYIIFK